MRRLHANSILLFTALIWGTTFSIQQMAMEYVPATLFTGIRFVLGALIVFPLALREVRRKTTKENWTLDIKALPLLMITGSILFLGALLQQIGIGETSVANAGFLTALYVPLTPIIAFFVLRNIPHPAIWPAAIACLSGAYLMAGGKLDTMRDGDLWVIAGTLFWAIHILMIGAMTKRFQAPFLISCVQFTTCGILGLVWGGLTETVTLDALITAWPHIAFSGFMSVGVGFTLQVVAQRHTPAADASIILSSETVFAAIAGIFIVGEGLDIIQIQGCMLILCGVLSVELLPLIIEKTRRKRAP